MIAILAVMDYQGGPGVVIAVGTVIGVGAVSDVIAAIVAVQLVIGGKATESLF